MNIQVYPLTSLIKIEKMMKTYLFITNSSELLFSKTYITCTIPHQAHSYISFHVEDTGHLSSVQNTDIHFNQFHVRT